MPDWLDNALKLAAFVAIAGAALQYQLLKNAREANKDLRDEIADLSRRLERVESDHQAATERVLALVAENGVLRSVLGADKAISDMEARLDAKAAERHDQQESAAAARHQQHEDAAEERTERLADLLRAIRDQGAA